MNLILASKNINILKDIIPSNSTIGFVATAGEAYENPYFVDEDRKTLQDFGYKIIEIDITNNSKEQAENIINNLNYLYISGGNVFYLMQQIKSKDLEETFIEYIKSNRLYIGASAGAAICCKTLEPFTKLDDPSLAPLLEDYDGLGVIDFIVLPHYGKEKYINKYNEIFDKYKDNYNVIFLKDTEIIKATNKKEYELFETE